MAMHRHVAAILLLACITTSWAAEEAAEEAPAAEEAAAEEAAADDAEECVGGNADMGCAPCSQDVPADPATCWETSVRKLMIKRS